MKPAAGGTKRKRPRDEQLFSDDEAVDSSCEQLNADQRPGQAERKRELERNRRNLINVRFAELDAELRSHAPQADGLSLSQQQQQAAKSKRIDKEAVLKEATQRLAVHRNDMRILQDRIRANSSEIENLRTEKTELRNDKAYLRSELNSVRSDIKRLRQDNINLWTALRRTSTLKDGLSHDVAKIPAELFLRARATEAQAVSTPANNSIGAPPSLSPPTRAPSSVGNPYAEANPSPNSTRQPQLGQPPELQNMPAGGDAFLVLQSAEELGHLLSMANSVANVNNTTQPNQPVLPQNTARTPTLHGLAVPPVVSPPSGGVPFPDNPAALAVSLSPKDVHPHRQNSSTFPNENDDDGNSKSDEDPFSDIAYCV